MASNRPGPSTNWSNCKSYTPLQVTHSHCTVDSRNTNANRILNSYTTADSCSLGGNKLPRPLSHTRAHKVLRMNSLTVQLNILTVQTNSLTVLKGRMPLSITLSAHLTSSAALPEGLCPAFIVSMKQMLIDNSGSHHLIQTYDTYHIPCELESLD
jgi:hypothetical protein